MRNARGNVLICVTRNPAAFPDCSHDAAAERLVLAAAGIEARMPLDLPLPGPGRYAISLIHDENGNGRLDRFLMLPREGYGFSRNPAIRFGPPDFAEASFAVDSAPVAQSVEVKYSL